MECCLGKVIGKTGQVGEEGKPGKERGSKTGGRRGKGK